MKFFFKGLWIVAGIGENWLSNYCLVPTPWFFSLSRDFLNKKKIPSWFIQTAASIQFCSQQCSTVGQSALQYDNNNIIIPSRFL